MGYCSTKYSVSMGYCSTKYTVSRDITVQNSSTQFSVIIFQCKLFKSQGIFHYTAFGQYRYARTNCSLIKDGAVVQIISQQGNTRTKYSVSKDISVQNIQFVRIRQYKIFSQAVYNIYSEGICQYKTVRQQRSSSTKY